MPSSGEQLKWLELLDPALEMFADLERSRGPIHFTIGGGTMLMRRYRHRLSRDLDFFVQDVSIIRALSPRLNDLTANLSPDYEEEAAAIKFTLGMSDVDVIAAPALTNPAYRVRTVARRSLRIEEPREIIAKKLFYRGRRLMHRDIFDLAVVAELDPRQLAGMASLLGGKRLNDIGQRLREVAASYEHEIGQRVEPLPAGRRFMEDGLGAAETLIRKWRAELDAADGAMQG